MGRKAIAVEDIIKNPTVFISYSYDSLEHADRVLDLADQLIKEGVDCTLDQYEDSPLEGWPKWMDRHIESCDFVIVICTETYYCRVMGEEEPGKGLGVKWESTLSYEDIYSNDAENTRFIPVLFEPGDIEYIPRPLKSATRYCVDTEHGYEELYRRLTNQPSAKRPKLGKLRKLQPRERKGDFFAAGVAVSEEASLGKLSSTSSEFFGREERLARPGGEVIEPPKVLLIRPVMNKYGSYAREFYEAISFSLGLYIKSEVLETEFRVVDLPGNSATRQAFESAIQSYSSIEIVVFLGHGESTGSILMGQGNKPLMDLQNVYLGEGKGFYCLCPYSAELLGKSAVSNGARFFIGFVGGFRLVPYGVEHIVSHCAVSGLMELIKGAHPVQAWARMQLEHQRWTDQLEIRQDELDPNWFLASAALRSNMTNLRMLLP